MNAEGPDVSSRFTGHPEDYQIPLGVILIQFGAVDAADPELPLYSRDEGWPLEKRPCRIMMVRGLVWATFWLQLET